MEINITLSVEELNLILAALQELPHKVVANLVPKLISQGQSQLAVTEDEESDD